jgi:hypothetical protein
MFYVFSVFCEEKNSLLFMLFILQMIYAYGDPQWNDTDKGKLKISERNLSQCHFFHHKSHMD